jgi:glutamate-1-semialdehyde 2,1-aminomutase
MSQIAPSGPIYQAGTLSGNPVAMAAGLATLELIQAPGFYEGLSAKTMQLREGLQKTANEAGIAFTTTGVCAMFGLYFCAGPINSYTDAMRSSSAQFNQFFHGMLKRGVYFAPSAFEAGFLSAAHGDIEINHTIEAAREVFAEMTP